MLIKAINATMQPLKFMEFSMEAPIQLTLLAQRGAITVNAPPPEVRKAQIEIDTSPARQIFELGICHGLPMATQDQQRKAAALATGVEVL